MHELNTTGLKFPLKFSNTPKFEALNPTVIVNVLVFENNEVFPLYASKYRDRKHHVNLLMISNSEGKFHYLLVRDLYALVYGRTNHQHPMCPSLHTASIASRKRVCKQLTSRIVPLTPSRWSSTPHRMILRKI